MGEARAILFTAFEPSGDALAAQVIRQLREARPAVKVWALGGPAMAQAGAELLENTTQRPVMFADALKEAWTHRQRVKRLDQWLQTQPIDALVPTDSPAANWSICAAVRRRQPAARIVHLAAPQLWAWAPWRVRKLRRLTDHVLCLLPFEPAWLSARGVTATFVGHPVFATGRSGEELAKRAAALPQGQPRLALLPGSRSSEIEHNWPTMLDVFLRLSRQHTGLQSVVAAVHERAAARIRTLTERRVGAAGWPRQLHLLVDDADAVLHWADLVLVVSGTATLQVAAHCKPMVVLFNTNWWQWQFVGRWLIRTRTFALPNLIARRSLQTTGDDERRAIHQRDVVPEFIPHFGAVDPLRVQLQRLIREQGARQEQVKWMRRIAELFTGRAFARESCELLLRQIEAREAPAA